MNYIACDGTWSTLPDGAVICTGTVVSVPGDQIAHSGMSSEDVQTLTGQATWLFAVVFGILAVKKALSR